MVLQLMLEVATFQGFLFFTGNLTLFNNFIMNSRFLSRIEIESPNVGNCCSINLVLHVQNFNVNSL